MVKSVLNWLWCPLVITVLAALGYIFKWPIEAVVPALIIILVIGLVIMIVRARARELELSSIRLRQLAEYFNRRFMGNSALSIFTIIDGLFGIENPQIWEWARACGMSQRIFDTWSNSFISRLGGDFRTRKFSVYLHNYLNELWSINTHYFEFIEQFHEVAERIEVPQDTVEQYNRLVMEYNAFVQNFRDTITELRKVIRTEIEPPGVKIARELPAVK